MVFEPVRREVWYYGHMPGYEDYPVMVRAGDIVKPDPSTARASRAYRRMAARCRRR